MVKYLKIYLALAGILLLGTSIYSQPHVFTVVTSNKSSVYTGEAVEINITAYTSTWFTKGVNPGNIKVDGAYSVFFRGVSVSKSIKGKNYAGVTLIYNIFPFSNNDVIFPSIEFTVTTPDEGDYKGVKQKVKTKEKLIKVRPIPEEFEPYEWLVANILYVSQEWSGNINDVKVGDVIERRVNRTAYGTVAGLIHELKWDSIKGVSQYPTAPKTQDIRSKTSISANRTDAVRYLFEKEGEVVIPEMKIQWWNPYRKRMYKRTIKELKINVQPNPDLGMIESVRDSLEALYAKEQIVQEEEKEPLWGLTKKQIAYITAGILAFIIFFRKIIRFFIWLWGGVRIIIKKRKEYKQSEKYHFRRFIRHRRNISRNRELLYLWIDSLKLKEPTIETLFNNFSDEKFINNHVSPMKDIASIPLSKWKAVRTRYIISFKNTNSKNDFRINP